MRPIVNKYREGKVKSTPMRGVKQTLKPNAYNQWEPALLRRAAPLLFCSLRRRARPPAAWLSPHKRRRSIACSRSYDRLMVRYERSASFEEHALKQLSAPTRADSAGSATERRAEWRGSQAAGGRARRLRLKTEKGSRSLR